MCWTRLRIAAKTFWRWMNQFRNAMSTIRVGVAVRWKITSAARPGVKDMPQLEVMPGGVNK